MFKDQETLTQWTAGKSHKTHFASSKNASQSLPKTTNSLGLYDGSAQARAILGPTFEGDITNDGAGVRQHALDYLKGKDVPHMGFWTRAIFEEFEGQFFELKEKDQAVVVEALVNPPEPNEALVAAGKEFLQQLRDKATSVEEVQVPIEPPAAN